MTRARAMVRDYLIELDDDEHPLVSLALVLGVFALAFAILLIH